MMTVNVNSFCALSRTNDFQLWLKGAAADLHTDLIEHLKLGKSCGSNKNKMLIIYDKLKANNLESALIDFLKSSHPSILVEATVENKTKIADSVEIAKIDLTSEEVNVHKVFPIYKPGVLMLPQQGIFVEKSYVAAMNKVIAFLRDKISTDYIVLKSNLYWHGYVEYFDKKFAAEADKVKRDTRPIALYRLKYGIKQLH